ELIFLTFLNFFFPTVEQSREDFLRIQFEQAKEKKMFFRKFNINFMIKHPLHGKKKDKKKEQQRARYQLWSKENKLLIDLPHVDNNIRLKAPCAREVIKLIAVNENVQKSVSNIRVGSKNSNVHCVGEPQPGNIISC
ncbi:hypothetical protein GIB67_039432, partial [Kingdonia uniflora]